jgi:photosystem II stability/assembly factor-like uncharacterized protein
VLEQIALRQAASSSLALKRSTARSVLITLRLWVVRVVLRVPAAVLAATLALGFPQVLPESGSLLDAGAAWHLQRPHIGYHLAVDSSTPNHLLAGAAGQVYETWNGGDSWHELGPLPHGLTVHAVLVDRAHPDRYLVATDHSIFMSTDRGKHWRLTAQSMPGAYNMFLLQDARNPATIYVGPSILWKSSNGGETWARAGIGTVFAPWGIQTLKNGPRGTLYTGIWDGGVAVSRDGGVTWQRRAKGIAPHVLGLSVAPGGTVWAATDRGVYVSAEEGRVWRRVGRGRFFATSVLAGRHYVLAGGDHVLYRSDNGGRTWRLSMEGLPLDPYIYDLEADPFFPGRVYAVLNGDGLFRSNDEGRHWMAIDTGIPLRPGSQKTDLVLFLRDGALWHTDSEGTDPGVSTVETDVRLATLAPDSASLVYLASFGSEWAVRAMSATGSGTQTVASGSSDVPTGLSWSPTAARLAIVGRSNMLITNLAHLRREWPISPAERFVGWSSGGNALLFWDARSGMIVRRSWETGEQVSGAPPAVRYPALPALASNGFDIAYVRGQALYVGRLGQMGRAVGTVPARCTRITWSNVGLRMVLSCGTGAIEISATGRILARMPGARDPQWAPGSYRDVLYFRQGALWKRQGNGMVVQIAHPAAPAVAFDSGE